VAFGVVGGGRMAGHVDEDHYVWRRRRRRRGRRRGRRRQGSGRRQGRGRRRGRGRRVVARIANSVAVIERLPHQD
jgi:hypothetical protein